MQCLLVTPTRAERSSPMTTFDGVPDMSGELASLIVYIVFLILCYIFYKIAVSLNRFWFILSIAIYVTAIYFYFEAINQIHYYLRDNDILYIEFGHASLLLGLLMIFFIFKRVHIDWIYCIQTQFKKIKILWSDWYIVS